MNFLTENIDLKRWQFYIVLLLWPTFCDGLQFVVKRLLKWVAQ